MNSDLIFISHASKDDPFVAELRETLEGLNLSVWVDSRNLRGGHKLAAEIDQAIEQARQVIVVLSPHTVNSPWVRKEIQKAVQIEQLRAADGYRVIPLLLPGVEPSALGLWFDEEPVGVPIYLQPGGLSEGLPQLLAALGERLPNDYQPPETVASRPLAELLLKLSDPKIQLDEGKRRATAIATLVYEPAQTSARAVESNRFSFTAPLGPIEADDLRWYLESYYLWPIGVFQERAAQIEAQLPRWGQQLYQAALATNAAREALTDWQQAAGGAERCFSVLVDSDLPEGASAEAQAAAREAASNLLSLPWELLHDGQGYLFEGGQAARVRRRLPNRKAQPVVATGLPIRILLVSPRPEDERASYIDHRISALPLVEAVESLGELATLTVLTPPTLPALEQALQQAKDAGQPFDVVHFDGHGVYDREHGLGGLCFEDPKDSDKLQRRAMKLIDAEKLAGMIRQRRIPLIFLEACESARTEENPTASVAAKLLEQGVTSVVAMSHSVLVETARRFVKAFYEELAHGARVGQAMLAGQRALQGDTFRLRIMGAGELHLQDWFVPVLYQEEHDPQLITKLPPQAVQQLQAKQRQLRLGKLPDPPPHHFQGRSRELLALERLLHGHPYAVLRGQGGAGKTTLAAELARWLVRTGRFRRTAFVSLEHIGDVRSVLDSLGRQLLPEGDNWSVASYPDLEQARQPIARALANYPTLVVLDNMESVLPDATGRAPAAAAPFDELFALCQHLLAASQSTRLLFTSRESLPAPFDDRQREINLGALSREDAIALVSQVMAQEGRAPSTTDPGSTPQEIIDLVEAVNRHARALVLLAREVSQQGVRTTTAKLHELMAALHQRYPDDREKSLYASVELSLHRLAPETREQIKRLGVFHGGAHLAVLAAVLDVDEETVRKLAVSLIEVGLAEDMGYGHLRLDPALSPYLWAEMSETEQEEATARWAEMMAQLAELIYRQQFKDAQIATSLTLLELPNLLALLEWMQDKVVPEQVIDLTNRIEEFLARLGRPQALAQVIAVRERLVGAMGEWNAAWFRMERQIINRLLDKGELQAAHAATQHLLQRSLDAGESAYEGAAYHIAMAYYYLGDVMHAAGNAETALHVLAEAYRRFRELADTADADVERAISLVATKTGDCLSALGRLDEAVTAYEEAIKLSEKLDDKRGAAVKKGQLGTVRMLQGRYNEALEIHIEACNIFNSLGEPRSVAGAWHQIGMSYKNAKRFDEAERAYRKSLAIEVQQGFTSLEAATLTELGNLYDGMGRPEEAVTFYHQAVALFVKLQNLINEGRARNNLARTLIKLQRYDESRRELHRAIECKKPYGHAAEPWTTWILLHDLEQGLGNAQAVAHARRQAIQCFVDYRLVGGENNEPGTSLCAYVAQAIEQGQIDQAEQWLVQFSGSDAPSWAVAMIPKLQAILKGDRAPALADDPNLHYRDAAELQLLLARLGA